MCNVLLGIFSPSKFEIPEYYGYDITKFKDNIRFLEVILNRDGNSGGLIGLFFDGATCNFEELPLPKDPSLSKVYAYIDRLRNPSKMFMFVKVKKFLNDLFN